MAANDVKEGAGKPSAITPIWQVTPPILTVNAPTSVNGPTVTVKGVASDDNQVKDLFIRVYNRDSKMPAKKVFYLSNRGQKGRLPFQTEVPLWPGSNIVQIFARETNEIQSVATLVVLEKTTPPSLVQDTRADGAGATAPPGKPKTSTR